MDQTFSTNRSGTMFDVCERLVPPRAIAVHRIPDSFAWFHEELPYLFELAPTSNKRPSQRQKKLISGQSRISAHPTPLPLTQTQIRHNKRPSRRRSFLQSILQIGLKPCFVTSSLFVITIYYFVAK